MTDNTMVKKEEKPKGKCEALKEKGETKGEI
jgi:hypothetical protein